MPDPKKFGPVGSFVMTVLVITFIGFLSYSLWRVGKWVNYKVVYSDYVDKELAPLKSNDTVHEACIKELKRQVDDLQARVKKLEEKK